MKAHKDVFVKKGKRIKGGYKTVKAKVISHGESKDVTVATGKRLAHGMVTVKGADKNRFYKEGATVEPTLNTNPLDWNSLGSRQKHKFVKEHIAKPKSDYAVSSFSALPESVKEVVLKHYPESGKVHTPKKVAAKKEKLAKGSTVRANQSSLLRYANFEDNSHINLLELKQTRNGNGLKYKNGNKYAISDSIIKGGQKVSEFKTLEQAETKFSELVNKKKSHTNLVKEGKLAGDNTDKAESEYTVKFSKANNTFVVWQGEEIIADFYFEDKANKYAKFHNDLNYKTKKETFGEGANIEGEEPSGLYVIPSTPEDYEKISTWLPKSDFYAEDYPAENYFFFAEEFSFIDNLEHLLQEEFNKNNISARFEINNANKEEATTPAETADWTSELNEEEKALSNAVAQKHIFETPKTHHIFDETEGAVAKGELTKEQLVEWIKTNEKLIALAHVPLSRGLVKKLEGEEYGKGGTAAGKFIPKTWLVSYTTMQGHKGKEQIVLGKHSTEQDAKIAFKKLAKGNINTVSVKQIPNE